MTTQAAQFNQLLEQLVRFRSPDFRSGMAVAMKEAALELVNDGFAQQADPYGRPWARSRAARERGGQTLRATGRLQRSFTRGSSSNSDEVVVGSNTKYAKTHQFGATIRPKASSHLKFKVGRGRRAKWVMASRVVIPVRKMLPLTGLPARWREELSEAALTYARNRGVR